MSYKLLCVLSLIIFLSCENSRLGEVEKVSVNPDIIVDDLESMMPGQLEVIQDYLLWTNPFTIDKFVHILDKNTRLEKEQIISRGVGPDEFSNPMISTYVDNSFVVYEAQLKKQFNITITKDRLSLDRLFWDYGGESASITRMIPLQNKEFVTFDPSQDQPFTFYGGDDSYTFGNLPYEGELNNRYDAFQGEIKYNRFQEVLVYSNFSFPYLSLYKKRDGKFETVKSVFFSDDYQIINGSFRANASKKGMGDLSLTRDYIVTLERDYSIDGTDEKTVGRDFSKLPQTIFLYDYDLKLKKIINMGMPILRIASDPNNNTVYAIGLHPDFVIVEFEIF